MARLIDADALKERLFNYYDCVNEFTSKSTYTGETLMDYEVADMIEDCIENAPTVDAVPVVHGRWIPVTERLPDLELEYVKTDDGDLFPCLVARKHPRAKKGKYVTKAWYDGYGFINGDSIDVTDEVTHWMLLPELPKEED